MNYINSSKFNNIWECNCNEAVVLNFMIYRMIAMSRMAKWLRWILFMYVSLMITTYSYHFVQTVFFFFVFPRNSKYLETLTDDKETSLQFCVHKNPTTVWKGMEHQFGESENCCFLKPYPLSKIKWARFWRRAWNL